MGDHNQLARVANSSKMSIPKRLTLLTWLNLVGRLTCQPANSRLKLVDQEDQKPDIYEHMDQPVFTPRVTHGVVEVSEEPQAPEQKHPTPGENAPVKETDTSEEIKVRSVLKPDQQTVAANPQPEKQEPSKPRQKNLLKYFLAIALILISSALGAYIFLGLNKNLAQTSSQIFFAQGPDTDSDYIPDNLEEAVGLDPLRHEFEKCTGGQTCLASPSASVEDSVNLMFLVSLSASMNLSIEGQTKIDLVKKSIQSLLGDVAKSPNMRSGLTVFGNEGSSSSAERAVSCRSAKTIAKLGELSAEDSETFFAELEPTGWSALAQGTKVANESFNQEDGINKLIIFTDKSDDCGVALESELADLVNNEYVDVHIVAINPSENDREYFSDIQNVLGVNFYSTSSISELDQVVQELSSKIFTDNPLCNEAFFMQVEQCIFETKKSLSDFSNSENVDKNSVLKAINAFSQNMDGLLTNLKERSQLETSSPVPPEL